MICAAESTWDVHGWATFFTWFREFFWRVVKFWWWYKSIQGGYGGTGQKTRKVRGEEATTITKGLLGRIQSLLWKLSQDKKVWTARTGLWSFSSGLHGLKNLDLTSGYVTGACFLRISYLCYNKVLILVLLLVLILDTMTWVCRFEKLRLL